MCKLRRATLNPLLFFALPLVTAFNCFAHDPGLSTATVKLLPGKVEATVAFATKDAAQLVDLDSDRDGTVSQGEFASNEARLNAVAVDDFILRLDGKPVKPTDVRSALDENDNVTIHLEFAHGKFSQLEIQSRFLAALPLEHRQYFQLLRANGDPLGDGLLSAKFDSISIQQLSKLEAETPAPNVRQSFLSFLELGIKHILTGYDHLLFLFALLLVTRNWLSSLKIITCFTLAHSVTLAVATFNVIQLPSKFTEPLIAASIVYVGLENILRHDDPQKRWLLTFAFGLIHGFGFASVLRELGVGENGSGVLLPLFSFNLGVELGQIAIAAMLLPFIWKLRTQPLFVQRLSPACSLLVALAGSYWFVQRVWLG